MRMAFILLYYFAALVRSGFTKKDLVSISYEYQTSFFLKRKALCILLFQQVLDLIISTTPNKF